ncbi:MAG TPA: IS110 family transposase [Chitinophagaceae bacterium]|jgi:transposase|nr:IS110 family transposase [Chitinophagaceae bacterium]
MKKIVKQVAGIDVAQKELVVTLGRMHDDWTPELYSYKVFSNTEKGFIGLVLWVKKQSGEGPLTRFVMEATGVYHESLAYFLDDKGHEVSIILPNKISNYSRTLEVKTVTDKTASEAIARFGLERKLDQWERPKKVFKTLRQLTREREQLVQIRTMVKNQLHAEQAEAEPNDGSVTRAKKQIVFLNKQEQQIKAEIAAIVKEDEKVKASIALITSIPGIGVLTAVTVMAETNGFELIRNKSQLTSYAGLDVKEKQSGTSVKGKARISKRGNKYLRKAMHLPALAAIRHEERFKAVFARLVAKHGIKMKAAVAVQRKLLEMIYVIYKSKKPYDKNYLHQKQAETEEIKSTLKN